MDYIDPEEGNFTLTESVAVVNKSEEKNAKAMEMAECIIKNGREELLKVIRFRCMRESLCRKQKNPVIQRHSRKN